MTSATRALLGMFAVLGGAMSIAFSQPAEPAIAGIGCGLVCLGGLLMAQRCGW